MGDAGTAAGVCQVLGGRRGVPGTGTELSLQNPGSVQPHCSRKVELQRKGVAKAFPAQLLSAALVPSGICYQLFFFIQVAGTGM